MKNFDDISKNFDLNKDLNKNKGFDINQYFQTANQVTNFLNSAVNLASNIGKFEQTNEQKKVESKEDFIKHLKKNLKEGKIETKLVSAKDLNPGDWIINENGDPIEIINIKTNILTNEEKVTNFIERIKNGLVFDSVARVLRNDEEFDELYMITLKEDVTLSLTLSDFTLGFILKEGVCFSESIKEKLSAILNEHIVDKFCKNIRVDDYFIGGEIIFDNINTNKDIDILIIKLYNIVIESSHVADDNALRIIEKLIKKHNFFMASTNKVIKDLGNKIGICFDSNGFFGFTRSIDLKAFDVKIMKKHLTILKKYIPKKYWKYGVNINNDNFIGGYIKLNDNSIENIFNNLKILEAEIKKIK